MSSDPSSPVCPDCGRSLPPDGSCLHCAMELALAAAAECPEASADLPPEATGFAAFGDPALPMVVGRFRLIAKLGMGGMGTVYEAEDSVLGRTVALKMVRGYHFSTADELSRFQREAQAAARLDHPHIVPVHEIGEVEGCPFLSMKLIRGGTLSDRLKSARMTTEEAAGIMAKVAAAVGHAHEKGILHRDLKPSNILLDLEGHPWLTDFGMARLTGTDAALTVTGAQIGTPHYMSPEQASGLVRSITPAADVWGLGAVFYQMLSGQLPYDGETSVAIMHEVISASPPRFTPGTKRELDLAVLIERCLQKEPADRLQSAYLLAEELDRWLQHRPIHSRPVSWTEKTLRWARLRRAQLAWGAAAVVGLAFGAWKLWTVAHSRAAGPAPGIVISREGTVLAVRDVEGVNQILYLSEVGAGTIRFREEGRHFQLPDGSTVLGTTDGISLAGVTRIVVDAGKGNDAVRVGGFTAPLPDLEISGGAGEDVVIFSRPLPFVPDAGLDLDLQNDGPEPGLDAVQFDGDSAVRTSGTGKIVVKCSSRIWVGAAELRTVDGGITLEANQQAVPRGGGFKGVEMNSCLIASDGTGPVTISGRGGTEGVFQFGISMVSRARIQGGTRGVLTLKGEGGASAGHNDNTGINLEGEGVAITTKGADILMKGTGRGLPDSASNIGIALIEGIIHAEGSAEISLEGTGGGTQGGSNHGILLRGSAAGIRSADGDIRLTGQGGGGGASVASVTPGNRGVELQYSASLKADGSGNVIVEGRGGPGGGSSQTGVRVSAGAKIDALGGAVKITGHPGNAASPGVQATEPAQIRTTGPEPRVTIEGERQEIGEGVVGIR